MSKNSSNEIIVGYRSKQLADTPIGAEFFVPQDPEEPPNAVYYQGVSATWIAWKYMNTGGIVLANAHILNHGNLHDLWTEHFPSLKAKIKGDYIWEMRWGPDPTLLYSLKKARPTGLGWTTVPSQKRKQMLVKVCQILTPTWTDKFSKSWDLVPA